jgi:hypothetical protein
MTRDQATALIVKFANDFNVLKDKETINRVDAWLKEHLPINSQITD